MSTTFISFGVDVSAAYPRSNSKTNVPLLESAERIRIDLERDMQRAMSCVANSNNVYTESREFIERISLIPDHLIKEIFKQSRMLPTLFIINIRDLFNKFGEDYDQWEVGLSIQEL